MAIKLSEIWMWFFRVARDGLRFLGWAEITVTRPDRDRPELLSLTH